MKTYCTCSDHKLNTRDAKQIGGMANPFIPPDFFSSIPPWNRPGTSTYKNSDVIRTSDGCWLELQIYTHLIKIHNRIICQVFQCLLSKFHHANLAASISTALYLLFWWKSWELWRQDLNLRRPEDCVQLKLERRRRRRKWKKKVNRYVNIQFWTKKLPPLFGTYYELADEVPYL